MTEWRTIHRCPEYEASDTGLIRRRGSERYRNRVFLPLSTFVMKKGKYLAVGLWTGGKTVTATVHTLICEAFHGPRPSPKHDAAHWDGDKSNNCPSNLRWATRAENEADKLRHKKSNRGDESGAAAVLTADQVRYLRRVWPTLPRSAGGHRIRKGATKTLEAELGVSRGGLYLAVSGHTWRHL